MFEKKAEFFWKKGGVFLEKKGGVFLKKGRIFFEEKPEFFWKKGGVFFFEQNDGVFCFCVPRKVKNFKFEGLKLEVQVVAQT